MSSLKNIFFFRIIFAQRHLSGEFAISFVLVTLYEPVNVETGSRNFTDLEVQHDQHFHILFVCLFDLTSYVPSTIVQLCRDGSSWVEPVIS